MWHAWMMWLAFILIFISSPLIAFTIWKEDDIRAPRTRLFVVMAGMYMLALLLLLLT